MPIRQLPCVDDASLSHFSFFFSCLFVFLDYSYFAKLKICTFQMRLGINWSVLSVFLFVYTGRHVADCEHKYLRHLKGT